jgi:DNA processing protein
MKTTSLHSEHSETLRHWLAVALAPALSALRFHQLLATLESPAAILQAGEITWRSLRLSAKTCEYLRTPDWHVVDKHLEWQAQETNHHIILFSDGRYPCQLREIADPPPVLFIKGNPETLRTPQIALVGSRNPTPMGRETAFAFAQALAQAGLSITSGMALGIDAASHRGALAANGLTIAAFGTGIDVIYPTSHRNLAEEIAEKGALISEFPLGTPPMAALFPQRNRTVSGLSMGTLVVEATARSGSLITARFAAEQGREVFAIPGSIHSPTAHGCHLLLRNGAKLVETSSDILEEIAQFQPIFTSKTEKSTYNTIENHLEESDQKLLECVGYEATSIDTLVARSGLAVEKIAATLTILELAGHINSTPRGYSRVAHERRVI